MIRRWILRECLNKNKEYRERIKELERMVKHQAKEWEVQFNINRNLSRKIVDQSFKISPIKVSSLSLVESSSTKILYIKDGKWEVFNDDIPYDENLLATLADIQKTVNSKLIEVIYDRGLEGCIYTFNNYNDGNWYLTGKTCGYA